MLIKIDLTSDVGCVRDNNEDVIFLAGELYRDRAAKSTFEFTSDVRFAAIVADGMGGHSCGEVASEIAVRRFDEFVMALPNNLDDNDVILKLKQWTTDTHRFIVNEGINNTKYEGMGSTFCGMLWYEKSVFALNIGDSRLYRFRGEILKQLSTDHSMRQLMGDMSLPVNQIYNSLGAGEDAFIDVKILTNQVLDNDLFLICSDGVSDMLSNEEIEQLLINNPTSQAVTEAAKNAGGKDNISTLLIRVNVSS